MRIHATQHKKGFTLVEMIVSIGLFTIVLFIASSAFLAVLNADRKSRATRTALDNLNLSLEDMSRRIKTGTTYHCGGEPTGVSDCADPGNIALAITDQNDERVIYKLGEGNGAVTTGNSASGCGNASFSATQGCLVRDKAGTALAVTGKDIDINFVRFVVNGTAPFPNPVQPYVTVLIEGVTTAGKITSGFRLQTTITQRMYDL